MKKSLSNKMKFFTVGLLIVSALMFAGCSIGGGSKNSEDEKELAKATTFQNMKLQDIEGKDVDSSVFKENKITIVNLWSTTCTPCIEELPTLDKISKEMKDKGVGVLGFLFEFDGQINDSTLDEAKKILKNGNISFQQLVGSGKIMNDEVIRNVNATPTTFAVDSNGKIVAKATGAMDEERWTAFINSALKKVK